MKNILVFILLIILIGSTVHAQYYNILTWESFENGVIPSTLSLGHDADAATVAVFPFGIKGTPKEMLTPTAAFECGQYGLGFFPTAKKPLLSLFSPMSLDRARLGENGRALYQADFYLPPEGESIANIALLAAKATEDGKMVPQYYRFGFLQGGTKLYFSYIHDELKAPTVFFSQPTSQLKLKRPGWHRFQIIFKGQEEIYCAVDRVETSFSPVRDHSLMNLHPGIMVAIKKEEATVVADNLSIQWSAEEVPLPDSPWIPRTIEKDTNLFAEGSPLPWYTNPSRAWTVASAQKRPLLVMFYSPKVTPYQYLLSIAPNDQATNDLLQRQLLARVDANQLWGASLAQKMHVFSIPTLVVMGPDGKETGRVEVVRDKTQWAQITSALWPNGPPGVVSTGN